MSFGDPNNPYGQQPQGQQPGYGYPQQTPQGVPGQQGYGYPAAPPVSPYGAGPGGFPGGPAEMPGGVKAARVILWIIGALNLIGGLVAIAVSFSIDKELEKSGASTADAEAFADLGQAVIIGVGVFSIVFAVLGMILAAKFKSGGNGVRICSIVYAAFIVLFSLFSLPLGVVSLALGVLIIVFCSKQDGSAWFNRQRQQF
ncbi:hypothetical protein ACIGEZ_10985 [Streptomyces sp. NPDC085481]|uniref:hypothetical protein n=1 Tax=Streptomyces sp. NPDC085481 TaxID=3365727 RepID=UPI0037D01167